MKTKIMPVTDLRRQTSDVIRNIRQTGDIVYITQHGRPTAVLIDFEQYEEIIAQLAEHRSQNEKLDAVALLQSWIDNGDEEEQKDTGDALIRGLDENRTSNRQLFPKELEGKSW